MTRAVRAWRDRLKAAVLAMLVPWLASGTPVSEPARGVCENPEPAGIEQKGAGFDFPLALLTSHSRLRFLRGDYEPPADLVLAYDIEWEKSVEQLVRAARGQARVWLLTHGPDDARPLVTRLATLPGVRVLKSRLDTPWVRDFGPFEVHDAELGTLWMDYDYSWERPGDDALPSWLSAFLHVPVEHSDFVLDGGAVLSNGQGICAITRTSLERGGFAANATNELAPLFQGLGCMVVAILAGMPGEPTGHADVLAQFLAPDVVAVAWLDSAEHPLLAARLDESVDALEAAADLASLPLTVVRVPIQVRDGVFYSYVNLTHLRTRLLVPGFDGLKNESETSAYQILRATLPGTKLVRIPSDAIARRGGGVHCVTLALGRAPGLRNHS